MLISIPESFTFRLIGILHYCYLITHHRLCY
uniref:Uncharacterized protein n=1 Tax=Arundo donax TaxID=35708 RepID=A0A0A9GFQ8_ARUDO